MVNLFGRDKDDKSVHIQLF